MFKYKVLSGIHYINGKMNRVGDVVVLAKKVGDLWPTSAQFFEFVGEVKPELIAEPKSDDTQRVTKAPDVLEGLIFPDEKIVAEVAEVVEVADVADISDTTEKPVKRRGRRKAAIVEN